MSATTQIGQSTNDNVIYIEVSSSNAPLPEKNATPKASKPDGYVSGDKRAKAKRVASGAPEQGDYKQTFLAKHKEKMETLHGILNEKAAQGADVSKERSALGDFNRFVENSIRYGTHGSDEWAKKDFGASVHAYAAIDEQHRIDAHFVNYPNNILIIRESKARELVAAKSTIEIEVNSQPIKEIRLAQASRPKAPVVNISRVFEGPQDVGEVTDPSKREYEGPFLPV